MGYELDLDLLRKKLSRARLQKEEPQYLIKKPESVQDESLTYLIENVLNPLLNGEKVHSADLDLGAFDCLDISNLYDFYMDHYYDETQDWLKLKRVYVACKNAVPLVQPVAFI